MSMPTHSHIHGPPDPHDDDPDTDFAHPAIADGYEGYHGSHRTTGGYQASLAQGSGCPHCRSDRIAPSHLGRRIGSAIGTLAGAAAATARVTGGAHLGAEFGAVLGTPAGPAGSMFGAVAGAVLGAMVGAAAGCAIGATLGEAIDAKILHNHQCLDCGRGFSIEPS
jgi:hypothetical protein